MWPFYSFQAELGSFVSVRIPFRIPLCSVPDAFITCFMERVTSAMVVERIASRCGSQSGIYFITCFGGGGVILCFFKSELRADRLRQLSLSSPLSCLCRAPFFPLPPPPPGGTRLWILVHPPCTSCPGCILLHPPPSFTGKVAPEMCSFAPHFFLPNSKNILF